MGSGFVFSSLNFRPYPSHTLIHKKDNHLFQATPKYPGLLANFKSSKLTEKKGSLLLCNS